jgi:hypothetical protein
MTFDDVRKIALTWPEVEAGTSYGTPALKVRKKMLARLKEDGDSLVMPGVPQDEREMLVESRPELFYFTDHYRDYPMVLIRLSKASRANVEPLLRGRKGKQRAPLSDLILRSTRQRASRRMNGTSGAAWFETALARLLTMRV